MPRAKKDHQTSENESQPYLFSLRGSTHPFFPGTLQVDFTPVKALTFDENVRGLQEYSITPKFNTDRKFYSQAFSNQYEGQGPDNRLKEEYKTRVRELSTQIISRQIMLPKPRSSQICYVCRQIFHDYLEHVNSETHKTAVGTSPFSFYISQLAQKHGKKVASRPKRGRRVQKARRAVQRQ